MPPFRTWLHFTCLLPSAPVQDPSNFPSRTESCPTEQLSVQRRRGAPPTEQLSAQRRRGAPPTEQLSAQRRRVQSKKGVTLRDLRDAPPLKKKKKAKKERRKEEDGYRTLGWRGRVDPARPVQGYNRRYSSRPEVEPRHPPYSPPQNFVMVFFFFF
jgi:hypothetical protein